MININVGDKLNTAKKHIKNFTPSILPENNFDTVYSPELISCVEKFLKDTGIVAAADGGHVNLANPDRLNYGKPTLRKRAIHLLTRERFTHGTERIYVASRAKFVWAVPQTIGDADVVAKGLHLGQARKYYFKNYVGGIHLVAVGNSGNVIDPRDVDGLITQYSPDKGLTFDDSFKVTYVKKRKGLR